MQYEDVSPGVGRCRSSRPWLRMTRNAVTELKSCNRRPLSVFTSFAVRKERVSMTQNYAQVLPWLRPLFGSALTLATVLAVVLNLLLRIGSAKQNEASTINA